MTQRLFRKLFPGEFHEYLHMKKYFFPKTGHDSKAFPETFSNIWKKFPEILLGHYPNLRNFKFYLKSYILEKVSGKSPESFLENLPIWVRSASLMKVRPVRNELKSVLLTFFFNLQTLDEKYSCCYSKIII